ncbi:MAG: hypothetical protein ACI8QC_000096 [Planctomycetota bacterium]|jgi:hypothetical protein
MAILQSSPVQEAPLLVIMWACLSACAGLPLEPRSAVTLERAWGVAGGPTEEDAQGLVRMVEHVLPFYRVLDGFEERPLRAHMTSFAEGSKWEGITVEPLTGPPWLAVAREAEFLELAVAHELAHFYFEKQQARFPSVLEEGLCDLLAGQVYDDREYYSKRLMIAGLAYLDPRKFSLDDPRHAPAIEDLRASALGVQEALALTTAELVSVKRTTLISCYGLGYVLARQIGWEGIVILLRRADLENRDRVPAAWILEQAGLSPPYDQGLREILLQEWQRVQP